MNQSNSNFQGLRTAVYFVADMNRAKAWYTEALGFGPYFDEPAHYVGFNVGGFELGLHPSRNEEQNDEVAGSVVYWGVDNVEQQLSRLIEIGAKPFREIEDVGGGIKVAEVLDPFGNILGLIENPHFPNTAGPDSTID